MFLAEFLVDFPICFLAAFSAVASIFAIFALKKLARMIFFCATILAIAELVLGDLCVVLCRHVESLTRSTF